MIGVNLLIDTYILWVIKTSAHNRRVTKAYVAASLILTAYIIVVMTLPRRSGSDSMLVAIMWMLYAYFTVYIPRYVFSVISIIGLPALIRSRGIWCGFNIAGAIAGIIVFVIMWWGALVNRTRIDIVEREIWFDNLPEAFDGYTIAQISDLHTGTFGSDTTFISTLTDRVNASNPDVIVFTGDIVNRHTSELLPFVTPLSRLAAPDGVYSILGNHDYGDYTTWPSDSAKRNNLHRLADMQTAMGWRLLRNEHATLHAGHDSIALIGVENWGDPPFTVYGDLDKAYPTLSDSTFKILLTHNPAHWTSFVADNDTARIDLSLSGHTHAMQIEMARHSPASWRYDTWGGLYADSSMQHKLYVNIGAGTVGLPMRIGATPEITIIRLRHGKRTSDSPAPTTYTPKDTSD